MSKAKFQTIYTITDERNHKFGTVNDEVTKTQQSDALDTDINVIMERYGKSGQFPQLIEPGKYGDFSEVVDFRAAQDIIHQANEAFAQVPAKIRKKFDNDPNAFFEFVNDPENLDEMRKLGLAKPEERPERDQTPPPPPETRYSDDGPLPDSYQQETRNNGNPATTGDNRPPQRSAEPPRGRPGGR